MKIRLEQIAETPRLFEFSETFETFPVLKEISGTGICSFCSPVSVSLSAVKEMDDYRVSGRVRVQLRLCCSRCLDNFEYGIDSAFTIFLREGSKSVQEDGDEVELAEQDLISSSFSGDEIDLLPEIGEQIVLSVPIKPLCSEGCSGLCPSCGSNLNMESCDCRTESASLKFSALKDFKVHS